MHARDGTGSSGNGVGAPGVRVLVVDDHALVRHGIASALNDDGRVVVIGEAADGVEAIEAVARYQPNAVLIDVNMPRMNGIDAAREIHRRWPDVRIVAVTAQEDEATANVMWEAGAVAFVCKSGDVGRMIDAVLGR